MLKHESLVRAHISINFYQVNIPPLSTLKVFSQACYEVSYWYIIARPFLLYLILFFLNQCLPNWAVLSLDPVIALKAMREGKGRSCGGQALSCEVSALGHVGRGSYLPEMRELPLLCRAFRVNWGLRHWDILDSPIPDLRVPVLICNRDFLINAPSL